MADVRDSTLEWMRRLDRRFTTLADRFDDLESRLKRVEGMGSDAQADIGSLHHRDYTLDRRLERLENRFETVEVSRDPD